MPNEQERPNNVATETTTDAQTRPTLNRPTTLPGSGAPAQPVECPYEFYGLDPFEHPEHPERHWYYIKLRDTRVPETDATHAPVSAGVIAWRERQNDFVEVGKMRMSPAVQGRGFLGEAFDVMLDKLRETLPDLPEDRKYKVRVATNKPTLIQMLLRRGFAYRMGQTLRSHRPVGILERDLFFESHSTGDAVQEG